MKCSYHKKIQAIFLAGLVTMALSFPAHSQTSDNDGWQYQLATYAWLAGQSGTVGTFENVPPIDIDIDFWDDVLGNINGALFLLGEIRKGSFGAVIDVAYMDIEDENATPGPLFSSASSRTKSWLVTPAAFYRFTDSPTHFIDIMVGFRYWSVDSTIALSSGAVQGREVNNSESWVDPLVGLKGKSSLGKSKFFISGAFHVGGFGVGSDLMWDANINLGYNWGEMFSTTIGYRYMAVDYEDDWYVYDISQNGPTVGLSWRF